MFTAPAVKLLNTLANAMIFADPKAEDSAFNLAAVRIRVENDVLDATGTTSFILGQGRTAGTGDGESWEALVDAADLKPVVALLRCTKDAVTVERTDGGRILFTIGGRAFELEPAEGRLPNTDGLFPKSTNHMLAPGFSSFSPEDLGRLAKLKDYTAPVRRGPRTLWPHTTPLTFGMAESPDKPAVATFGPDFRILIAVRRGSEMPDEQAAAGGTDWRLAATR